MKITAGKGWKILPEGTPLKPGDAFMHPAFPGKLIDYRCRPDIFRISGTNGGWCCVRQTMKSKITNRNVEKLAVALSRISEQLVDSGLGDVLLVKLARAMLKLRPTKRKK